MKGRGRLNMCLRCEPIKLQPLYLNTQITFKCEPVLNHK